MSSTKLSHDELWPRAGGWQQPAGERTDLTIVGVPTSRTSLSPTNAHETPAAIRDALRRYSTHIVAPGAPGHRGDENEIVLHESLSIADAGDVVDPDTEAGEEAAAKRIAELAAQADLVVALGGDNACTVPAALGVAAAHGGLAKMCIRDRSSPLRCKTRSSRWEPSATGPGPPGLRSSRSSPEIGWSGQGSRRGCGGPPESCTRDRSPTTGRSS